MKKFLTAIVAFVFFTSTLGFAAAGSGGKLNNQSAPNANISQETGQVIEGQYIVVLKPNKDKGLAPRSAAEMQNLAASVGATAKNVYATVLEGFSGKLSDSQVRQLLSDPAVDYIEPDRTIRMVAQTTPWGISHINAPVAHSRGVTGSGVKVGIIDTGIDHGHPDLAALYAGGIDFVNGDNDPMDDEGHGTHVSGTVAAIDNTIGVLGVAPAVSLYGIKVLDRFGSGTFADVIAGIDWAAANGMDVVNMSLGAGVGTNALQTACDNAYASGVVICAAAGNNYGGPVSYPAKYSSAIAVSAIDQGNNLANFSNRGAEVEVTAPGVSIYSTYRGGGYATMDGTSMATPHTTGVCALIWATGSFGSASAVRSQLTSTAIDLGSAGRDNNFGYGLIDADAATAGAGGPPTADFSGSPTSGTEPLTVSFSDLSTGSPTSWSWNFGDGGTSTQQNPSHTFATAGNYTVALTATNGNGSNTATKNNYITVNPCIAPTAGFSGSPLSGDYPLTVGFSDASSGAASYSWDFGDGGSSTASNPNHTYNAAGTYSVTQTVTNSCGSDQLIRSNYITVTTPPPPPPPVADFSGTPTTGSAPLTVSFSDLSSNSPTSWSWDFGDGGTSTQQNPGYTYNAAGTYTVSLTATNVSGSDIITKVGYITVNTGPIAGEGFILSRNADFSTDDRSFTQAETIYMKVWTDVVDNGNLKKSEWELKDANKNRVRQPFTNNGDNTYTASFALSGLPSSATSWTWKGKVEDNNKVKYNPTTTITITTGPPPAPVADFSGNPTSGFAPLAVSFSDLSTNSPTSWAWDFGDGGSSTAQNPSYTFATAGTYTVSLTATNSSGSNTMTKTGYITVNTCTAPTAGFAGSPTSGDFPLAVSFSDQSTNGPTSWAWDFGDGGTSTAQNPNHTYTAAGTYDVTLTATNSCGSDQLVQTGYITVTTPPCNPPVAAFSGTPTSGNAPLNVSFTDQTSNSPTSWAWDFGDGGTSTQQNPGYTYNNAGTYTVTLTATNSCGSDQLVQTNYITVTAGGPVTGEGFILSRNADFSTDDRTFTNIETIYMKVWSDVVDFNDINRARWELKDANKNKIRQNMTNNFDGTYTASFALSGLPSNATSWTWKGEAKDNAGNRYKPTTTISVTMVAGLGAESVTPSSFELSNYPNPFNPSTEISFTLPQASHVLLEVYNVSGQLVDVLADGQHGAGEHIITWDGSGRASGIYFYRLQTDNALQTKKMLLLK